MRMLHEQVRPSSWGEVVGHRKVKRSIAVLRQRGGLGGKAFWLSGKSGIGKSTIAYLIAADVCDPDNFEELDAGDITPAAVNDLERRLATRCIGLKNGRAVLVNEAHGLRKDTIRKLLVTLERIPQHVVWVFTTTTEGQLSLFDGGIDASPLVSRCLEFELEADVEGFAKFAKSVADENGLGGASLPEYVKLINECEGNLRKALGRIERGDLLRESALLCG